VNDEPLDPRDLARLFALGANDVRTPLATLSGFTRTLARELADDERGEYAVTIEESAGQISGIVERLALIARIQEGRYTPPALESVPAGELARAAVKALGADRVDVRGEGAPVEVARQPTEEALTACARAAMRHGGTDSVIIDVEETGLTFHPIHENARPVLGGSELREFGAAAALIVLETLGIDTEVVGDRFRIQLPQ